jgi:hypothetical protein
MEEREAAARQIIATMTANSAMRNFVRIWCFSSAGAYAAGCTESFDAKSGHGMPCPYDRRTHSAQAGLFLRAQPINEWSARQLGRFGWVAGYDLHR